MTEFLLRRAEWLHRLTKPQKDALFAYRRAARAAYPDAENAMDAAWDDRPAPDDEMAAVKALVVKMPRDLVVSLDRGP